MRQIALEFINAVNEHDVDKISALISGDHVFIDSHGNEVHGRDEMKEGWVGYFKLFPGYKIEVKDLFEEGNVIALLGYASGSFNGNKEDDPDCCWKLPAAWKAVIEEGKIKLWQVYADTKIPFEIISKFPK
jgi:ketosteroid isomerase-like protein